MEENAIIAGNIVLMDAVVGSAILPHLKIYVLV